MLSNSSQLTRGFTVRSVYCCSVCGLEVDDYEQITRHLADKHNNAETVSDTAAPQQRDNTTSSCRVLPSRCKSKTVRNELSDGQTVSETVDCKPLVCPKCKRVYKYRRCFERHIKRHKTATQSTVSELQCTAEASATSQLSFDAFNSSDCERKQDDSVGSSTADHLNHVDQLELQEVTGIPSDVLTSDKQTEEEACKPRDDGPYCCPECPQCFVNLSSFRLHTIDKHSGWTFVCTTCGQLFIDRCELRSHKTSDHSGILDDDDEELAERVFNSHRCKVCSFSYQTPNELAMHMTSHDDVLAAFACSMCSGRYLTKSGLKNHMQRVHSGDHPYFCKLCGDRFVSADDRDVHVEQHTLDLCPACGVRLCRRRYDGGKVMCSVCYLEQLSSRDGVQVTGRTVAVNSVAQRCSAVASLPFKYNCSTCGVRFAWRSNLRRHERKHTAPDLIPQAARRFQCSYCGRVFNRASGLRKHIFRHVQPGAFQPPSFCCRLCGQRFSWKKSLVRHLRTAHPPSAARCRIPVMACSSSCDSTAASSASSETDNVNSDMSREPDDYTVQTESSEMSDRHRQHAMKPSEDAVSSAKKNKMLVPCPECGAAFFSRSNLMRHIREHHHGNKRSPGCGGRSYEDRHLLCRRCGRRFSRLNFLRVHLQAHENVDRTERVRTDDSSKGPGVRSEPMLCSECGEMIGSSRRMLIHMQRHAGVRPHQCRMCDKSFFIADQLNKHVSVVHHGHRFICEQCGHEANSKSALKLHSRSTHPTPGVEPSYPCRLCSRRFWSRSALQRHAEAHDSSRLSKRKAMCSLCSLVFRHVYNLTHHIKTTHVDTESATPFACATCNQQFDSGSAFKTHYRSKHRNR